MVLRLELRPTIRLAAGSRALVHCSGRSLHAENTALLEKILPRRRSSCPYDIYPSIHSQIAVPVRGKPFVSPVAFQVPVTTAILDQIGQPRTTALFSPESLPNQGGGDLRLSHLSATVGMFCVFALIRGSGWTTLAVGCPLALGAATSTFSIPLRAHELSARGPFSCLAVQFRARTIVIVQEER